MKLYFTQIDPIPTATTKALADKGWRAIHHPFRTVVFDQKVTPTWADYDAVVVTSKQAATWLRAQAPTGIPPIAAVGGATHHLLTGFECWFSAAPPANAQALVKALKTRVDSTTIKLLFLCGNHSKDTVPRAFPAGAVDLCEVYATHKLSKVFPPVDAGSMVYFQAPTTALDYFSSYQKSPPRVAVIGPSTAAAVRRLGWTVDFQPSRPETATLIRELPTPDHWAPK